MWNPNNECMAIEKARLLRAVAQLESIPNIGIILILASVNTVI
jgi:hypothetical protein